MFASLNMTDSSMVLQKAVNVFRQLSANAFRGRDLFNGCLPQAIHGAEPPQQQIFPVLAYPETIVENTFLDPFFHEQLMICVSEPMRLIADALKQSQGRRIHWKSQRQCAAWSINLLVFFRQTENRKVVQAQALQFTAGD
jgi:hypothetical protein